MEPLGRFWESFWNFPGTFGRLLENVSKTIQKVTKVHQKSPKGAPKAPKRLPKSDQKECFWSICEVSGFLKRVQNWS